MINDTHISICGIGPGNPDYISNVVYQQVEHADLLIGGKRQLSIFSDYERPTYVFEGEMENLKASIANYSGKYIVVLVSGDTGFFSLRRFLVSNFSECTIKIYPGISSFQYFYAQLSMGYENAYLSSVHGTQSNYIDKLKDYSSVFLLSDKKNNYKSVAHNLIQNGYGNNTMHLGSNLSYKNEKIISVTVQEAYELDIDFALCSIIIENPLNI